MSGLAEDSYISIIIIISFDILNLESWGFPKIPGQHFENCCCIVVHQWRTFKLLVPVFIEWLNYILGTELGRFYSLSCSAIKNNLLSICQGLFGLLVLLPQAAILTDVILRKSKLFLTNQSLRHSHIYLHIDSRSCSILGPVTCKWRTYKCKFNLITF